MDFYLKCSSCGEIHTPQERVYNCKKCRGRLEVLYPYDRLASELSKKKLEGRNLGIWKYLELLPILDKTKIVSLGEGNTRLHKCDKLSNIIGVKNLYVKNETTNPTGSYKARPAAVGISRALELGADGVVVASDGNVAPATSAYAAHVGLRCCVFVPDYTYPTRIIQTAIYGAEVFVVRGDVNKCIDLATEVQQKYNWHHLSTVSSINPYQIEGSKTISYEICEQLGWVAPDWIIVPVGGGGLITSNWKGLKEFLNLGLIDNLPKMVGVQASGCAPFVKAYRGGKDEIKKWEGKIDTIAVPIAVPYPLDGQTALTSIRSSGGTAVAVSDREILDAGNLLARTEAIIAEPAGVTSLAGLKKLLEEGTIDKSDNVVFEVTGTGLRELKTLQKYIKKPKLVEPKLEDVENAMQKAF